MQPALSNDDVLNILFREIAEHGDAKIVHATLLIQQEGHSRWIVYGTVDDPAGAQGVIHDFFS